jgi:hypothetical protein
LDASGKSRIGSQCWDVYDFPTKSCGVFDHRERRRSFTSCLESRDRHENAPSFADQDSRVGIQIYLSAAEIRGRERLDTEHGK